MHHIRQIILGIVVLVVAICTFQLVPSLGLASPPECGECDGKVTQLTLKYLGTVEAIVRVTREEGAVEFDKLVQPGGEFTLVGSDKKGTLGSEIKVYVDGALNTKIHTSCSQPIGPGLVSGDFKVIEGYSENGGLLCPLR